MQNSSAQCSLKVIGRRLRTLNAHKSWQLWKRPIFTAAFENGRITARSVEKEGWSKRQAKAVLLSDERADRLVLLSIWIMTCSGRMSADLQVFTRGDLLFPCWKAMNSYLQRYTSAPQKRDSVAQSAPERAIANTPQRKIHIIFAAENASCASPAGMFWTGYKGTTTTRSL